MTLSFRWVTAPNAMLVHYGFNDWVSLNRRCDWRLPLVAVSLVAAIRATSLRGMTASRCSNAQDRGRRDIAGRPPDRYFRRECTDLSRSHRR